MSASQRRKGRSGEQEVVTLAKAHGLTAQRTWQTAMSFDPVERCCDVLINQSAYQVKRRGKAWGELYDALQGVEGVFCRADGKGWLVVQRADDFLRGRIR